MYKRLNGNINNNNSCNDKINIEIFIVKNGEMVCDRMVLIFTCLVIVDTVIIRHQLEAFPFTFVPNSTDLPNIVNIFHSIYPSIWN